MGSTLVYASSPTVLRGLVRLDSASSAQETSIQLKNLLKGVVGFGHRVGMPKRRLEDGPCPPALKMFTTSVRTSVASWLLPKAETHLDVHLQPHRSRNSSDSVRRLWGNELRQGRPRKDCPSEHVREIDPDNGLQTANQ